MVNWHKTRRVRWLMWGVLAFAYFFMTFNRVSTAVLAESLTKAFDLTATELGLLHSSFFYLYAVLQLPAGLLVDRYGARRVAGTGTLVMGVGVAGVAISDGFVTAFLARALMGLGGSVLFLSILRFAVTWFRADEYATVTGMTIGVSAFGGIVATTPLAFATAAYGWRPSLGAIAAVSAVAGVAIFLFVRDEPADEADTETVDEVAVESTDGSAATNGGTTADSNGRQTKLREDLHAVLGQPDTWVMGVIVFLVLGVNLTMVGLWAVPYLVHVYGVTVKRASRFVLLGNLGLLVGSPLFGWLSDRTGSRSGLILASTVTFLASYALIAVLATPPIWLVGVVLFVALFVNGGTSLTYTIGRERYSDELSGTVSGSINSIGYAGAAIVPGVMGATLDAFWTGRTVAGSRVYSLVGYRVAFGIATAAGIVALLCSVWVHRRA